MASKPHSELAGDRKGALPQPSAGPDGFKDVPAQHVSEDLDAEGFGYWPEEAQASILRRDEKIARLEEQNGRYEVALKQIAGIDGYGGHLAPEDSEYLAREALSG